MSNVIDFLEKFGGDAQLRGASAEELDVALALAGIDDDVRMAIINKDQRALEALLGAHANVCCMINKPDEEEEEEEDEDDEEEEEDDEEEDSLKSLERVARRVA